MNNDKNLCAIKKIKTRKVFYLPIHLWISIIALLDTEEILALYSKTKESIYMSALRESTVFKWNFLYSINLLPKVDLKRLFSVGIHKSTIKIKIINQPIQVQFLNLKKAQKLTSLTLRNLELNTCMIRAKHLKKLTLDNVYLGNGYVLEYILKNCTNLSVLCLTNLFGIDTVINKKIWNNLQLTKLVINNVIGLDYFNLVSVQHKSLQELVILSNKFIPFVFKFNALEYPLLKKCIFSFHDNEYEKTWPLSLTIFKNIEELEMRVANIESLLKTLGFFFVNNVRIPKIIVKPINSGNIFKRDCAKYLAMDAIKLRKRYGNCESCFLSYKSMIATLQRQNFDIFYQK